MTNFADDRVSIFVDFSIFTKKKAFGRVSGLITLPIVPQIGDTISLQPLREIRNSDFVFLLQNQLKVIDRIIPVNKEINSISISLREMVVDTEEDAEKSMKCLESYYGLLGDPY